MIADEQIPKPKYIVQKLTKYNISQQFTKQKTNYQLIIWSDHIDRNEMDAWYNSLSLFSDSLPDPASFPGHNMLAYILKNVDSLISTPIIIKAGVYNIGPQIEMKGAKYNKLNDLDLDLRYLYFGQTSYQPFSNSNQTFSSGSPGSSVNLTLSY